MKKSKNNRLMLVLTCIGILLILSAIGLLAYSSISAERAQSNAKSIVANLHSLMPEVKDGAEVDRSDTTMPMLQLDGENFIGIIEVPQFGTTLPIRGSWSASATKKYPCRYMGSVYDGSLIIGGSDNDGQFDFVKKISNGDSVYITDTTGTRYRYTVLDINRTKDVSTEYLTKSDAALVLFARNTYSLDYTVIYCK